MSDPYQILNLDANASIEEVNKAYFYIAKIYHPNKGGNEEEFLRFQAAYKQIVDAHAKGQRPTIAPKDFMQLRDGQQPINVDHQYRPCDFRAPAQGHVQDRFSQELFNRRFQEQQRQQNSANDEASYTYDIDNMDLTKAERREDEYKREYAQVTAEMENITPFGNGSFNNTTFNHAFTHLKEQQKKARGEVEEVGIPNPTASREIMHCTDLENPKNPGTGEYTGFKQAYDSHTNPNEYDKSFLAQFQGKPDITKVEPMKSGEARKRMNDRQNAKLEYNKEKLVTDLTVALKEVEGLESKKAAMQLQRQRAMLQEQARVEAEAQARAQVAGHTGSNGGVDMFERMAALRSPVHVPQHSMLGPERPMASVGKGHNRETAGYIAQPAAILLQGQGQNRSQHAVRKSRKSHREGRPPPIQKKQHRRREQSNDMEDELLQMKRDIRRQQKIIKQLSRKLN